MKRGERMVISQNEVNTFRTCMHKWGLRYLEGLRPITEGPAPRRGSAIHEGIAAAYGMAQRLQQNGGEVDRWMVVDSATSGVMAYFDTYARDMGLPELSEDDVALMQLSIETTERAVDAFVLPDARRYEIAAIEHRFSVPLRDEAGGRRAPYEDLGYVDVVLRDPEANEWIVGEFKTTSADCSSMDARLDVDPQTPGYVYSIREDVASGRLLSLHPGAQFGRVQLNCVRTKGETKPSVNKVNRADVCHCEPNEKGKVTKHTEQCDVTLKTLQEWESNGQGNLGLVSAKAVDCTKATYQAALDAQRDRLSIDPTPEQLERLEQLPDRGDRWACRHEWFYSEADVDRWRREQLATAFMIRQARRRKLPLVRNGAACAPQNSMPCAYRSVCVQDSPEVRDEMFVVDHGRGGR